MSYLDLIKGRIEAIRADLPKLTALGEKMATPLLAGGSLFTPQIGTYWPSEFGGRAGGLMGLKPSNYVAESANDVAFTTLPDPRRSTLSDDARWRTLIESPAQVVVIGPESDAPDLAKQLGSRVSFTGGASASDGLHAKGDIEPLTPLRPFDQLVRAWLTTGEMIAAMTRGGRMPIIWMSVWLEGAMVRNASFFKHDNVREPWHTPLFHDKIYIPPIEAGTIANAFMTELERMYATLSRQTSAIATGGQWMRDAVHGNKRISTVLVGHSYPEILELNNPKNYPLAWLPSISDLRHAHPMDLGEGDVALHLGYSPVDVPDVQRILDRGARFIYSSPYGRPTTLKDHENLLWLDLPWRPADATVDVPGYSVRVLPMSSSAHTMAYFALVSELAQRMGWN